MGALLGEALGRGVGTKTEYVGTRDGAMVGALLGAAEGTGVGDETVVVMVRTALAAVITADALTEMFKYSALTKITVVPGTRNALVTMEPTEMPSTLDKIIVCEPDVVAPFTSKVVVAVV